ncbi:hypothetical protein Pcinc_035967 [Petrolisthes cinctipes]|uniref:Uncharacterized protein n=1 Tax=Petrolisthes cinctipes TaxID=88211 RepID=A0AAE1BZU1_PETCI|nr:hypothetical protein Pcinc_035967 [Petrolisthes cinctipes]
MSTLTRQSNTIIKTNHKQEIGATWFIFIILIIGSLLTLSHFWSDCLCGTRITLVTSPVQQMWDVVISVSHVSSHPNTADIKPSRMLAA